MYYKWSIDTGVIYQTNDSEIFKWFKKNKIEPMAVYFTNKTLTSKQFLIREKKVQKSVEKLKDWSNNADK